MSDDDPPPRTTTKAKKTRVVIDDTHPKVIKRVDRFTFAYKRAIARAQREAKRTGKEVERRMRDAFFFLPRGSTEEEEGSKKRMETHRRRRRHESGEKDYYSSRRRRWFSMLSAAVGEKTVDPMKRSAKRLSNEAKEKARKLRANLKRDTTTTAKKNRRKNESPSSFAADDDDARSKKKNETFSDENNDGRRVRLLERERKKMEEKWKEVVEKVKEGTKMTTTTSSSSSSGATTDARKQQQKREDEHKKKKKNTSEENTKREERSLKKKAEKMTKELRLELKENANKLNSAIDASKKEAEAAFAIAKDRVMSMTVKKDVVRDRGKNKNTKQEKKQKNSTRTSSSSSRDSENKNKKKTTTSETPTTPTNIFERSKSVASDFVDTATTSVEDVKGNIETVQKSVAKKISDLHLRENFEGTTQNIARESKKIVTEDLPSTIKTLSKESANLTGSAMKEFNENIDVDVIAHNAKKSIEGTSKTVESLIRDVQSNASLAAASGKAIVTDLIDPPEKMHRVRKGESLLKIARKYDVSVVDVCRVNNLVPTDDNPHFVAIKIGQILNIPNSDRMAEQPAYENSKFDQKFESTVNAYYEQRLLNSSLASSSSSSSSSSSNTNNKVAVVQVNNKSTSSGNAKLAGSFALLVTAAAISYLRAGLDDDINDEDENDGHPTIPRDDATNNNNTSQML
mgnify:CR=1 FL=1